ncbi:hypothetical protein GOODEAATRI_024206 [Goodea atripinnis]|uniref:Uncharacterized protein n=1 Tax=Goodea atripinnis TaxID=208336 RepID=A0ABV0NXA7_9TELE
MSMAALEELQRFKARVEKSVTRKLLALNATIQPFMGMCDNKRAIFFFLNKNKKSGCCYQFCLTVWHKPRRRDINHVETVGLIQIKPKMNMHNTVCGDKLTLHIILNTPSSGVNMVVGEVLKYFKGCIVI